MLSLEHPLITNLTYLQLSSPSGYVPCIAKSVVTSWWSTSPEPEHTAYELDILWTLFFSMPMFLISKVLSNFFFQDIADAGFTHTRDGHRTRKKEGGAFRDLADLIYDSVLLLMLGIQVTWPRHGLCCAVSQGLVVPTDLSPLHRSRLRPIHFDPLQVSLPTLHSLLHISTRPHASHLLYSQRVAPLFVLL